MHAQAIKCVPQWLQCLKKLAIGAEAGHEIPEARPARRRQVQSCPTLQVSLVVTNRFVPLPEVYEHERFLVESLSLSGMYRVIARSAKCMHKLLSVQWHGGLPGWLLPLPCCFGGPSHRSHACSVWWLLVLQQHARALPLVRLARCCQVCTVSDSHSHVQTAVRQALYQILAC